jgi:glycosyltransferase involved in cell wall biosynthesis
MARRELPGKTLLLKKINSSYKTMYVTSYKLHVEITHLEIEKVCDVTLELHRSTPSEIQYQIMWTVVHCSALTRRAKKKLKRIVSEEFPVKDVICIPYHDSMYFSCDYVLQTAKQLARKHNDVLILHLYDSDEFSDTEFHSIKVKKIKFTFIKRLIPLEQSLHYLRIKLLLHLINPTILWCFDTRDSYIIPQKTTNRIDLYDCVDNFTSLDKKTNDQLANEEKALIRKADIVTVNSRSLYNLKKHPDRKMHIVPLGFDIDSFKKKSTLPIAIKKIPQPKVLYVGNLTYRLDFALLHSVIRALPFVSFVFVGDYLPVEPDDTILNTKKQLDKLKKLPNAYFPGRFSRNDIKSIIQDSNICIIPYNIRHTFNKYCYPMKLMEYFYLGKPVISTNIIEVSRYHDLVFVALDTSQFIQHIQYILTHGWKRNNQKRQNMIAKRNSWESKIQAITNCITLHG